MPLFGLFKKSSKKEPAQPPKPEDSVLAQEMQKRRYNAAMDFLKDFQERMPLVGGKPHAGTSLSAAARLAGTSLYRSLNYKNDIKPGTVILSNEVNKEWPQLMNLFAFYCKQNGIDVMSKPMVTVFPEQDKPRMSVEQIQQEFQDRYHQVMKRYDLDYLNGARAGMIVCAVMFKYHCIAARDIDPYVATGIVALGVVEGAKTAPPPLNLEIPTRPISREDSQAELIKSIAQNSTNGTGNRLVLGEGMAPMQETARNGGRYILLHPQVESMFKQNNIDPFLMYETAMRMEIASKIPSIEFIGVEVDALLQAWAGKPEDQAPIHVRQALWLQKNARRSGYEKMGNSWKLKQ